MLRVGLRRAVGKQACTKVVMQRLLHELKGSAGPAGGQRGQLWCWAGPHGDPREK